MKLVCRRVIESKFSSIEHGVQGIYIITNKINNKVYIGQSVDIRRRLVKHVALLRHNYHWNLHLQNAWNKYGEDNFEFDILEIVENENELVEREQYYIDVVYQSRERENGYNIRPADINGHLPEETKRRIGDANRGRKHSEEFRRKISEIQRGQKRKPLSEETKRKISEAQKGKKISEETRRKISNTLKGRKTGPPSEETRRKISEAQKGKPRKKHSKETRMKMSMNNGQKKINDNMAKCIFEKFTLLLEDMKKLQIYELLSKEYNVHERTIRRIVKEIRDGKKLLER